MLPLLGKKTNKINYDIGLAEAHYLWQTVKAKYDLLQLLDTWTTQVHDQDLLAVIKIYNSKIHGELKLWEDQLFKFGVHGPDGYTPAVNAVSNPQVIRDQIIAVQLFTFSQEHIGMLIKAFRTATTNDDINNLFKEEIKKTVEQFRFLVKYIKAKGWLGKQPMFHNNPRESGEEICAGEALNLWDHLTYRNDNIEFTQAFIAFIKDGDFKLFLEKGLQTLLKQAKMLEKELIRFRIPLPNRPPSVRPPGARTDLMDDDSIFRWIFQGIQGALSTHAQSLFVCTHNARVRDIFRDLLFDELDFMTVMIKYAKLKGWLNPALRYGALRS